MTTKIAAFLDEIESEALAGKCPEIAGGVYLINGIALTEEQKDWADEDGAKDLDFGGEDDLWVWGEDVEEYVRADWEAYLAE